MKLLVKLKLASMIQLGLVLELSLVLA